MNLETCLAWQVNIFLEKRTEVVLEHAVSEATIMFNLRISWLLVLIVFDSQFLSQEVRSPVSHT